MDKKTNIIENAMILFNEFGFNGTPTSKIAKVSEISNGALFHYFPTKVELINEIYWYVKSDLLSYFKANKVDSDNVIEQLFSFWRSLVKWAIINNDKFLFQEQFLHSVYVKDSLKKKEMKHFNLLLM